MEEFLNIIPFLINCSLEAYMDSIPYQLSFDVITDQLILFEIHQMDSIPHQLFNDSKD